MPQPPVSQELTCNTCGAPVKTNAKPGTVLKCDCCGATIVIPEAETQSNNQAAQ